VALQATLAPLAVDITQATARIPHAMRASQVELGKTIQAALAPLAADIANATAGLPAMMEACEAELGAALKARLAPLAQDIASATAGFPAVLEDYQAQFDAALQARLASVGDDIAAGIPAALDAGLAPLVPLAQDVAHATAGIPGLLEDCRAEFNAALQARLATLGEDIAACIPAALNAGLAPLAHGITAATAQIGPTLEARLAPLAEEVAHAAASFPEVAEGLQAHLGALETLGPVLDGVTEKLIETADALATAGDSLPPIADAARRAVDAMALAALNRPAPIETMRTTPARPTRPAAQPGSSVAASILGRLAAQEEPAIAATLMRLDGIGTEVASLLRDTENLVGPGNAVLSRPVASRAPELLESLDETIRGLQSISTAIAVAADRRLEHARAS
jgi:uncharacterized protein YicC (UPF0701 family)